jgi:uncharacterized membrane protein
MAGIERSGQPRQARQGGHGIQASRPAPAQGGNRVLALVRREPKLAALLLMAVAGIGIAVYLTLEHFQKAPLFCSTTGTVDCAPVLSSAYSVVPGTQLPITVPGMVWFVVSGALAVVGLQAAWLGQAEPARLRVWQLAWSGAGLLFVLYLIYAEIVLVHKICAWCTGVHVLTLLTFLVALARWQEDMPDVAPRPAPAERSQRRPDLTHRPQQPQVTREAGSYSAGAAATGSRAPRSGKATAGKGSKAARTQGR